MYPYETIGLAIILFYILLSGACLAKWKDKFLARGILAQVALLPFIAFNTLFLNWGSVSRTIVVLLLCFSPSVLMLLRYKLPHGERLERAVYVINMIILVLAIILGFLIALALKNIEMFNM